MKAAMEPHRWQRERTPRCCDVRSDCVIRHNLLPKSGRTVPPATASLLTRQNALAHFKCRDVYESMRPAITITKLLYSVRDALQAVSERRLAARLLRAAPHRITLAWRDLRGVGARLLRHVWTGALRVDGREIPIQSRTRLSGLSIRRCDVCKVYRSGRGAARRAPRVFRVGLDVRGTGGVELEAGCRRLALGAAAR